MKELFWIISFFIVTGFYSCTETSQTSDKQNSVETIDTVLNKSRTVKVSTLKPELTDKSRMQVFFVMNGNDTSKFKCSLSESSEGKVGIRLWFVPSMSYHEQIDELSLILEAAKDSFQFDSLRSLTIGRLYSTGDMAIGVTNEYLQQNKKYPPTVVNKEISDFLMTSSFADDFGTLLKLYSGSIDKISVEKAFFAEKKYIYSMSKIETDSSQVPDKVLDALVSIRLR